MDKATTIGDILAVQQRLTDVQGQIEELSGQLAGLTDQAAYSTLTVIFVVPVPATPSPSLSPTPTPRRPRRLFRGAPATRPVRQRCPRRGGQRRPPPS
jgi:hypothetical protein